MKKFLNNHSGFSLVMAITAMSVVLSGTYYLIEIRKANKSNAVKAKTINAFEAEKKRISTILSDSANCTQNFQGQLTGYTLNAPFSLYYKNSAGVNPFLTSGLQANTKLTLTKLSIVFNPASQNSGMMTLTYDNSSSGYKTNYTGKNLITMKIPFYQLADGANKITTCYAITETQKVGDSIEAACTTGDLGAYSNFNKTAGVTNSCSTNFTLNASTASNASIDCALAAAPSKALRSFSVVATSGNDTGRTVSIAAANCESFSNGGTGTCAANNFVYAASNSGVSCAIPGANAAKDTPVCAAGQLMYKTGSNSINCVTPSCTGVNFISGFSSAGASCLAANAAPCPAGQYAQTFYANGTVSCQPFPVMSGSCSASWFGISFTRNNLTNNGTLNCSAYTKTKMCGAYQSLSGLTASGSPICTPY